MNIMSWKSDKPIVVKKSANKAFHGKGCGGAGGAKGFDKEEVV